MVIDMYSCYVNNFSVAMEELKSTKAALSAFLTVRFDYMTIIWGTTTRILIIFGVPPHKYKYLK
jgi:hypothetical protein